MNNTERFAAVLTENFVGVKYDETRRAGTATIPNVGVIESRSLVKEAKRRDAAQLDATRQDMITNIIPIIDLELSKIPLREFESDTERYPGITCWHYGDSKALAQGRSDEATRDVAFLGWVQNRIRELVPSEWYKIEVLYEPRSRSRTLISMGRKAEILALAYLRSH